MGIDVDGEQWLKQSPQLIRDAKPGRGAVVGRALSLSLLRFLFAHDFYCSRLFKEAVSIKDDLEGIIGVPMKQQPDEQ
ncbi:conserved hypothetical protein [Ktedonobacter racemifer DSM 44963]|uniref:Uncharacterized protein n=1 Tax=Ktedonobacter racemifer DSM 44963 TaxID=485913 RepID=D6TZQ5_KTERA|nr:conserved hypothetical protein [Ktedonobacter racemifer DSM 44963]